MIDLNKFIKALELVKPAGRLSLGLIINQSAKKADFKQLKKKTGVKISGQAEDVDKTIVKMQKALASGKWLVLEIKNELPAKIYAQLRLLSLKNRMQFTKNDEVIDLKQPEETLVIVEIKKEALPKVEKQYPDFRNLFGPVIEI